MDTTGYGQVAESAYLDGLQARGLGEIRSMRAACQSLEDDVSMARRIVQGRLDIVRAEIDRRTGGGDPAETGGLLGSLPDTLTDHGTQFLTSDAPAFHDLVDLETVLADDSLANLPELSDGGLDDLHLRLLGLERVLSDRRRVLFERIDVISDELARRYRSGEASVDSLLR